MAQIDEAKPSVFSKLATQCKRLYQVFFEPVTFVLAIVAIAFAVIQYFDSRTLVGKAEAILGAASTRYIGAFPEDISGIREIISNTCSGLDIMVSVPGYGQYSNPEDFDKYKMALESVALSKIRDNKTAGKCLGKELKMGTVDETKAHVRLLLLTKDLRQANMRDQFDKEFLRKLGLEPDARKFIDFFQKNPAFIDVSPEEYRQKVLHGGMADFLGKLENEHHWNEEVFHHDSVDIRYSSEPYAIYFWLVDDQEVAFTLDRRHGRTLITFRTRDTKLLDTFRKTFKDVWDDATPYDDYWRQVSGKK